MARPRGRPTEQESLRVAREPLIAELRVACAASHGALAFPSAERNRELEDSFFRASASLEGFLSDWFVRCLSFNTTRFVETFERRGENQAAQDLGRWAPANRLWARKNRTPVVQLNIPIALRLSFTDAREYLGWRDRTHSFRDSGELQGDSAEYLVQRFANRVAQLPEAQKRLLDAVIKIRNVLAHRSQRGATEMNQALADADLPAGLRRGVRAVRATGVGNYLRTDTNGDPRFHVYYAGLAEVACALAPGSPTPVICP